MKTFQFEGNHDGNKWKVEISTSDNHLRVIEFWKKGNLWVGKTLFCETDDENGVSINIKEKMRMNGDERQIFLPEPRA